MSDKIYEPIRRKIEEWVDYKTHNPNIPYQGNEEVHDEYRRWHDRDCVLTGGNLCADTMFSLWRPLKNTIIRLNDEHVIQGGKYQFIQELLKEDMMEKLLPVEQPIVRKLSTLFALGFGRENVFLLPDRKLNLLRGRKPYDDYMPAFLFETFGDGAFAQYWSSPEEHLQWIEQEHLQMFFDGDILSENIKDLSGSGDVRKSLAPDGIQPVERMIDNYISILQERRNYFTTEELENAEKMDEIMSENSRIQAFRDRIVNGDPKALMQVTDVMDV
ncbi:MAG: hypothetical protein HDR25_06755 [Lachnospiraceae bacterium]|nr:hypothetical protein [Lachnospiraceae bacterium]